MKPFKTTVGGLRAGKVLPGWEETWDGLADDTPVIVYPDGSMKVGDSDWMPLPVEAYGNTPPEGWEALPWEAPKPRQTPPFPPETVSKWVRGYYRAAGIAAGALCLGLLIGWLIVSLGAEGQKSLKHRPEVEKSNP